MFLQCLTTSRNKGASYPASFARKGRRDKEISNHSFSFYTGLVKNPSYVDLCRKRNNIIFYQNNQSLKHRNCILSYTSQYKFRFTVWYLFYYLRLSVMELFGTDLTMINMAQLRFYSWHHMPQDLHSTRNYGIAYAKPRAKNTVIWYRLNPHVALWYRDVTSQSRSSCLYTTLDKEFLRQAQTNFKIKSHLK